MNPDATETSTSEQAAWRRALGRYGPWVVAIGIFVWIFQSVSFADAWEAARSANLFDFGAALTLAVGWWFLLDSAGLAYLFSALNAPVSWKEARSLRALSYLVTPINWNLGHAAMILHLRQSKNIGPLAATSTLLFYTVIDVGVMTCLLGSSIWLLPDDPGFATAAKGVIVFMGVQAAILAIAMTDVGNSAWLEKLRNVGLLQSWRRVRVRNIAALFGMRAAYFAGFVFLYWWGTRAFGVDLPLPFVAATMPIIQSSAALPITPAGLGTQQAVLLEFYRSYGPESAILAFGVAFPVGLIVGRMLIGVCYVRDLAEFRRVRAEAQAEAESEATAAAAAGAGA